MVAETYQVIGTHQRPAARLPQDDDFSNNSAYLQAAMFIRYLLQQVGKAKTLAFYQHMVGVNHSSVAEEFHNVTGADFDATVERWKAQFSQQFSAMRPSAYWD